MLVVYNGFERMWLQDQYPHLLEFYDQGDMLRVYVGVYMDLFNVSEENVRLIDVIACRAAVISLINEWVIEQERLN